MKKTSKIIITILALAVPSIFFIQFFNLGFWFTYHSFMYDMDITIPSFLAGIIFFWGSLLIIYGSGNAIVQCIKKIKIHFSQGLL